MQNYQAPERVRPAVLRFSEIGSHASALQSADAHVGVVKEFQPPSPPKSPAMFTSDEFAKELQAYEDHVRAEHSSSAGLHLKVSLAHRSRTWPLPARADKSEARPRKSATSSTRRPRRTASSMATAACTPTTSGSGSRTASRATRPRLTEAPARGPVGRVAAALYPRPHAL